MSTKATTLEKVKDGVDDVVEKAREAFNDGIDAAKDRFNLATKRLDRRYRKAAGRLRIGAALVREKLADTKDKVADGYSRASRQLGKIDRNTRRYVSNNPRKAILIAAGVGLFAGLVLALARREPAEG
jgi:ElaB/YqjD/DUF883 family membrane-anchored ribosome-binding protein